MNDERDLQQRFHALRAHDETRVPRFAELAPAEEQPARRRWARWPLALAASLALVWVGAQMIWREPTDPPVMTIWTVPTDALLSTPIDPLLRELPELNESTLDQFIYSESNRSGVTP